MLQEFVKRKNIFFGFSLLLAATSLMSILALLKLTSSLPFHTVNFTWIPSLNINLSFIFDKTSFFFGLLVSSMGVLIIFYSYFYFRNIALVKLRKYYIYLSIFMLSMLGTVFSNNLILLFVFWEITSFMSFFLIGFNYNQKEAQSGAKTALFVTCGTGLALLLGFILLGLQAKTFLLSEILLQTGYLPQRFGVLAVFLILLGIIGKSAQFPLHFWLPNAMKAPTPVSVYLHSATMVKLGVFLAIRFNPLFVNNPLWFIGLILVGCISMIIGSLRTLVMHDIKVVLANATIGHLGYFLVIVATKSYFTELQLFFHILNHFLYKGILFMAAGIIIMSTGLRDLRKVGSLMRTMPMATLSLLIAAACMAGLPFTTGYYSKQMALDFLLFRVSKFDHLIFIVLAAYLIYIIALSATAIRFVYKFVFSKAHNEPLKIPSKKFQLIPFSLAITCIIINISLIIPINKLSHILYTPLTFASYLHVKALHLAFSVLVFLLGSALFYIFHRINWRISFTPSYIIIRDFLHEMRKVVYKIFDWINIFLRIDKPLDYLFIILSFFIILMAWAILPILNSKIIPYLTLDHYNYLEMTVILFIVIFAFSIVFVTNWPGRLISLSITGFLISFFFMLNHAPDLALTQMLIEVLTLVLFLLLLGRFPKYTTQGYCSTLKYSYRKLLALIISIGASLVIFSLIILSTNNSITVKMGSGFIANSKMFSLGKNIVNNILVDFRGFDSLGEITVLIIAMLGALGLLMKQDRLSDIDYRFWRKKMPPSPILCAISPYVAIFINILAAYLFFKGHNEPGGGFIAGVAASISLILLVMIFGAGEMKRILRIEPINLAVLGLFISYCSAILPIFWKASFFTHKMYHVSLPLLGKCCLGTSILFDLGIFFVVLGINTKIVFVFSHFAETRISYITDETIQMNSTMESKNISAEKEY
jgi:NADH:ubiquinone oxidoreductase subunit 5 (subunit L)/multisubunit Na+/H+ antiporter MnhA subunit